MKGANENEQRHQAHPAVEAGISRKYGSSVGGEGRAHQKFVNTAKSVICTPDPGQESPDALIGVSSFFNFFFMFWTKLNFTDCLHVFLLGFCLVFKTVWPLNQDMDLTW